MATGMCSSLCDSCTVIYIQKQAGHHRETLPSANVNGAASSDDDKVASYAADADSGHSDDEDHNNNNDKVRVELL